MALSAGSIAAEAKKPSVDTFTSNVYTQALIDRIDASKDGKVSKAEFLKFMEAEFNALDTDKNGFLETSEMIRKEMFNRVQKRE